MHSILGEIRFDSPELECAPAELVQHEGRGQKCPSARSSGPKMHATHRVWVYKHGRSREVSYYCEAMSTELPMAATHPVTWRAMS